MITKFYNYNFIHFVKITRMLAKMFLYNQCFILNLTLFLFHADKNNESRIRKNIQSSTNGTIEHEKV